MAFSSLENDQLDIGPLKLLRLLRLLRLSRLLRAFPELMVMIQGMLVAIRAVGSAMLLLVVALLVLPVGSAVEEAQAVSSLGLKL